MLMSGLLIYIFNPRTKIQPIITTELKILLFLFGIILLITADWGSFFKESTVFQYIQNALANREYKN
jgi:ribose/xylose/arabinose/galactoside ABC-type transport system permease subunit